MRLNLVVVILGELFLFIRLFKRFFHIRFVPFQPNASLIYFKIPRNDWPPVPEPESTVPVSGIGSYLR
jgi:hypothetical protein